MDTVIDRVFSTDHIYRTVQLAAASDACDALGAVERSRAGSADGRLRRRHSGRRLDGTRAHRTEGRVRVRVARAVHQRGVGRKRGRDERPRVSPPTAVRAIDPGRTRRAGRQQGVRSVEPACGGPRPGVQGSATNGPAVFLDAALWIAARSSKMRGSGKRVLRKPYPDTAALLSSWRYNVPERRCPGVVFNAMAAETGQPMLFATVALPETLKSFDFYEHYPGPGRAGDHGGQVVVRLSRTWCRRPAPTPMARRGTSRTSSTAVTSTTMAWARSRRGRTRP